MSRVSPTAQPAGRDHGEAPDGVDHAGLVPVERLDRQAHRRRPRVAGDRYEPPAGQPVALARRRPPGPSRPEYMARPRRRADWAAASTHRRGSPGCGHHVGLGAPRAPPSGTWRHRGRGRDRRAGGRCGGGPSRPGPRPELDHVEAPRRQARGDHDEAGSVTARPRSRCWPRWAAGVVIGIAS